MPNKFERDAYPRHKSLLDEQENALSAKTQIQHAAVVPKFDPDMDEWGNQLEED